MQSQAKHHRRACGLGSGGWYLSFQAQAPPTNAVAKQFKPVSIRRRLQATTLLAVLAGYGSLLVMHRVLADQARRTTHEGTVAVVQQELLDRKSKSKGLKGLQETLNQIVTPSMLVWIGLQDGKVFTFPKRNASMPLPVSLTKLVSQADFQSEQRSGGKSFVLGGHSYYTSSVPVVINGEVVQLRFLRDFTDDASQEQTIQLLLIAAAGISCMFTSLLLRPVIRRGLQPLDALSERLEGISSESLSQQRIPLDRQPGELRPIAQSFNGLLDRLERSWDRQKSFVNGVSHELRTPITLISGYAHRLSKTAAQLSEDQKQQIQFIQNESRRMASLVSDLLDLARSDAGKLQLSQGQIHPSMIMTQVAQRLQDHTNGRLVVAPLSEEAEAIRAKGDGKRLDQCIMNLIENAMKYAPGDSPIQLSLSYSSDEVSVHVTDSGPGVPASERSLIFERFKRGRHASETSGSGIGLAVVQTLMRAMGGDVTYADAASGGADFRLSLKR